MANACIRFQDKTFQPGIALIMEVYKTKTTKGLTILPVESLRCATCGLRCGISFRTLPSPGRKYLQETSGTTHLFLNGGSNFVSRNLGPCGQKVAPKFTACGRSQRENFRQTRVRCVGGVPKSIFARIRPDFEAGGGWKKNPARIILVLTVSVVTLVSICPYLL